MSLSEDETVRVGGDEEDGDGGGTGLPVPLITIRGIDPLSGGAPLLDDPVTGAGNDDLWTPTTPWTRAQLTPTHELGMGAVMTDTPVFPASGAQLRCSTA